MSDILYYNRYTGQLETEEVYGESYLRWTYETTMGRLGLWLLVKRAAFSNWYGWRMNQQSTVGKIRPFIETYDLAEEDFLEPVESYSHFNDFFYRKLKPAARPLKAEGGEVALPADARHLGVSNVDECDGLFAKGQRFDLESLLGDRALAERFRGGAAVISRLCPVDYHRFHSPVSGRILEQRLINGPLFSVSPIALRKSMKYLWENKRVLSVIDSEEFGRVAFVAIGATCVGSVLMTAKQGASVEKGGELGYFAFGGSCVISIFEKERVSLRSDLAENGAKQVEVYAQVRDVLGKGL